MKVRIFSNTVIFQVIVKIFFKVRKDFEINNLGEYFHLYFKNDTLLWDDVFKNFRKMCLKMYHLDHAKILSAPGLA